MKIHSLFAAILLSVVATATPVESFNLARLIRASGVIVAGTVTTEKVEPAEIEIQGHRYPANSYSGRIVVEAVLKPSTLDDRSIEVHRIVPHTPGGSMGYSNPRTGDRQIFFLRSDGPQFTWTSHTYPSIPAPSASVTLGAAAAGRELSAQEIELEIVKAMDAFAEEATHPDYDRAGSLGRASYSNLPVTHDTALWLVNDASQVVRETAISVLARFKDKIVLPIANALIAEAANDPNKGPATNVLLALSQEFKDESVPAFEVALAAKNVQMQQQAAFAARYTESNKIIPSLLTLVSSPGSATAWNAMHSLGELTKHMDWRPMSQDPAEFQRCIALWEAYAHEQRFSDK